MQIFERYLHEIVLCVLISPNINSTEQKRDVKTRISSFFSYHQFDSRKRAAMPTEEEKAMTKMLWLLWELHHNWNASRQTRSHWILKRKQSRGNPMQKVLGSIQRVRITQSTLCQVSIWENKSSSLAKIQVTLLHQRSPYALKFEDRCQDETEDNSDTPKARRGILSKIYTNSKTKTRLHSNYPQRSGNLRLRQQKSRRKDSLWWFPELLCLWSIRKFFTLSSWRSRNPTMMTNNVET